MQKNSHDDAALHTLIDRHSGPFVYGISDCVCLAADAVELVTGERPNLPVYKSKKEAITLLSKRSLWSRVRDVMGSSRKISEAEFGDVVIASFADTGEIVGFADPPVFWVRSNTGMMPIDLTLALEVFPCRKP